MPIKLYAGIQGSGKSYEVVSVVILGSLREGRRVVSNIAGLNYEAMRAMLIEEGTDAANIGTLLQVDHNDIQKPNFFRTDTDNDTQTETIIQPGDVVIVDEIWRFWEKDSQVTARQQNFFRMHRHMLHPDSGFCCEIALITQDVGDVCRKIRAVVEKTYLMTKHTELGTDKHYRVDIFSRAKITARTEPLNSYQKSYEPKYFALYKSHSQADEGVFAKEKSIDVRGNIWSKPIIKYGFPVALLMFASAFYFVWKFFHPVAPKIQNADSNPSISAPVASSPASKPEAAAPLVSDQWRVMGWYFVGNTFVVSLKGQGGSVRYLHNSPNYQLQGHDLSVLLPEGGFATTYSGNFDSIQRGAFK